VTRSISVGGDEGRGQKCDVNKSSPILSRGWVDWQAMESRIMSPRGSGKGRHLPEERKFNLWRRAILGAGQLRGRGGEAAWASYS
jgi:hypothetical protein